MAFKKMSRPGYPLRLWALVGYPRGGKSTFATQMRGPLLPIDADNRFAEVMDLALGNVYQLSDRPTDNTDPDRIAAILAEEMPGSDVGTIVVDSLTAIIAPLVVQAMADKEAGRVKNLAAAFRSKALAMRQLQDAVTRYGTDVLWIYHLQDGRDEKGRALTRATISQTELARLARSVNLQLEVVQDGSRRGIKVVWARRGRAGMTLWDDTGTWAGMPERVEAAVYGGLTEADRDQIESATPEVFPNAETAISWGLEQGAFQALQHARNAYNKLRAESNPADAYEMATLWVADVQARLLDANGHDAEDPAPRDPPSPAPPADPLLDRAVEELGARVAAPEAASREPPATLDDTFEAAMDVLKADVAEEPTAEDPEQVLEQYFGPRRTPGGSPPDWVLDLRRRANQRPGASDPISLSTVQGILVNLGHRLGAPAPPPPDVVDRLRAFLRALWTVEPEEMTKAMLTLTAALPNDLEARVAELERAAGEEAA